MENTLVEEPQENRSKVFWNKSGTYMSKPENIILLVFGVLLTLAVVAPVWSIISDSFTAHAGIEKQISGASLNGFSTVNWQVAFVGYKGLPKTISVTYFWGPLGKTLLLAVLSCTFAIIFGGFTAFLVTRTNMPCKRWISTVFIFPYIMPQWTLAIVWRDLFWSTQVGGVNGILSALFGWTFPEWWCVGLFPSAMVLGLHYAAFAYIMIGGIFRNMDSNLEEAATILNTPKWKIFFRVTLPMITPGILSTILLVFTNSVGSYPVPHYLKYECLATKYVELSTSFKGIQSIIAMVMMLIGLAILAVNIISSQSRKQYTTVTGKAGQAEKINLGKAFRWVPAVILIIFTTITAIYPMISFAIQTFLPNPGDYSYFTTKWWVESTNTRDEFYGQFGIFHNSKIWKAFGNSVLVAVVVSLIAGTIGVLIGYAVSKKKKSRWAQYVNGVSFLPYLLPSLGIGAAFFILGSRLGIYGTLFLVIIVGVIKYIPFSSRASLNAMSQLSGEIEEAAIIQNANWPKRMGRIIVPIQKASFLSGYFLPFITCIRELTLFMLLVPQGMLITTLMDYYDEMHLPAFSSAINLILIIFVLAVNLLMNTLTGASIDSGIGGGSKK